MKVIVYSFHPFEREYFERSQGNSIRFFFSDQELSVKSASLSAGFDAVCLFTSDDASAQVLELLHQNGVRYIALRSAGYNHVDLSKAKQLEIQVARVPAYSPSAVAEHAVALMLVLNRKLIQAHNRVMEQNFSINGLTGFDMNGKTVGIMGTGKIGSAIARILHGFGCRLLAYDIKENEELKKLYQVEYTELESMYRKSDILTLHLPLNEDTRYLIDFQAIQLMKQGVMIINTARGGLIHTEAILTALKNGHIGYFGMDVYEKEHGLFFEDHSGDILQDDTFARLMLFRNVVITGHQAFLTDTALKNIAETTIHNLDCFSKGHISGNELT